MFFQMSFKLCEVSHSSDHPTLGPHLLTQRHDQVGGDLVLAPVLFIKRKARQVESKLCSCLHDNSMVEMLKMKKLIISPNMSRVLACLFCCKRSCSIVPV